MTTPRKISISLVWPFYIAICFALLTLSAKATLWYVDNAAITGTNDGTSWTTAWMNVSGITGVGAGDTVYISGGPSGSYRTNAISSWNPAGGSAGSPITYQIGQDANHNGTVIFSGTGTWLAATHSHITISGDAGDGLRHLMLSGYGQGANFSVTNAHISYVNFGNIAAGLDGQGATALELDHCYCCVFGTSTDHFFSMGIYDTNWNQTRIHDNVIYVPHATSGTGNGADIFQVGGSGYSIYNNTLIGYDTNYIGDQHQDGLQTGAGSYIKVYNNTFQNIGNCGIYLDAYYGAGFSHVWIYNNVLTVNSAGAVYPVGIMAAPQATGTWPFTDVVIANNTAVDYGHFSSFPGIYIGYDSETFLAVWTNCLVANNVGVNAPFWWEPGTSAVTNSANVSLSSASGTNDFVTYALLGISNDFHLVAAATNLIGQGVNLSAYFTTDKGGNTRGTLWDIGALIYISQSNPVTNRASITIGGGPITITICGGNGTITVQ